MRYGHQPLSEVKQWPILTLRRVARILSDMNDRMSGEGGEV